jgi:hypothetical protein
MKLSKKQLAIIALVAILAVSNIVFAYLYMTKDVNFSGGISVLGEMEVYHSDGETVLTGFGFNNFTGLVTEELTLPFFINNTGNMPLYVYWNISTSSLAWTKAGVGYSHLHDVTTIYSFSIYNASVDYWIPETEARILGVDEDISETFSLLYTGESTPAETFSLTVTFYARDA